MLSFDEIFTTCCTGNCHFDNVRCSQWSKFDQNEDISVSMIETYKITCSIFSGYMYCHQERLYVKNTERTWRTGTTRTPAFWEYPMTTHCPMITHTIDSYWILSQNKTTSKLQNLKKMSKFQLLDFLRIVEDTEQTRIRPQTDGQTDGRTDGRTTWNQYRVYSLSTSLKRRAW